MVSPFVLPAIMIVLSLSVGTVCFVFAAKLIKRQIKLYNSITLVRLKSGKLHYWIFFLLILAFIIYIVLQMISPDAADSLFLQKHFMMERWHSSLMFSFLLLLLFSIEFLLAVIAYSKSAVVDRGIYTVLTYFDWYHVHDYLIDEDKCVVVLSSEKDTFSTIKGTTPPLKVAKNDIAKLKFILNKNKNKFSGFTNDSGSKL